MSKSIVFYRNSCDRILAVNQLLQSQKAMQIPSKIVLINLLINSLQNRLDRAFSLYQIHNKKKVKIVTKFQFIVILISGNKIKLQFLLSAKHSNRKLVVLSG
jgi:hypothetical protein